MRGWSISLTTAFFLIAIVSSNLNVRAAETSSDRLQELKRQEQIILAGLRRIENGMSPCTTDECQSKKKLLIQNFYRLTDRLPSAGKNLLPSRRDGTLSAYQLIHERLSHSDSSLAFPNTLKEWIKWWKKRYSNEEKIQSRWKDLCTEVFVTQQGLRLYSKTLERTREDPDLKNLIEEAWQRGAPQIAEYDFELNRLAFEINEANEAGDRKLLDELKKETDQIFQKKMLLEEKFGGSFKDVLENVLFPDAPFEEILSFMRVSQTFIETYGAKEVFDPEITSAVPRLLSLMNSAQKNVQEFNDLEYGVLGLKNMYSAQNPALAAQFEIPIQTFLDHVDTDGRILTEMAAAYLMGFIGKATFGPGVLSRWAPAALANFFSIRAGKTLSERIWSKSQRSQELKKRIANLEDEMERRNQELWNAERLFKNKLEEVRAEMSLLENK